MYEPPPGGKVLDIGCGTGTHLAVYADTSAELYGVDLSPSMLAHATARLGDRAGLLVADARALPFPDATFDLVIAASILHELEPSTAGQVVEEVRRALRPDGRFLVVEFCAGKLTGKGRLIRAITHVVERIAGRRHYRSFRAFMRRGGLPALAIQHGFSVENERVVSGGNMHIVVLVPT